MARQLEDADDWDDGCESDSRNNDEDEPTVPCPYCGKDIYEDAPRCPHCGQYISEEDVAPSRAPWWIILGVLLCLCATVVWIISW